MTRAEVIGYLQDIGGKLPWGDPRASAIDAAIADVHRAPPLEERLRDLEAEVLALHASYREQVADLREQLRVAEAALRDVLAGSDEDHIKDRR